MQVFKEFLKLNKNSIFCDQSTAHTFLTDITTDFKFFVFYIYYSFSSIYIANLALNKYTFKELHSILTCNLEVVLGRLKKN